LQSLVETAIEDKSPRMAKLPQKATTSVCFG